MTPTNRLEKPPHAARKPIGSHRRQPITTVNCARRGFIRMAKPCTSLWNARTTKAYSCPATCAGSLHRSEEHTSELQSLMRISYAVFCLKKKNHETKQQKNT